jgi:hypothetical protein
MELKIGTIDKSALLQDRILQHWRADGQMRDIQKRAKGSSAERISGRPRLLHHPGTFLCDRRRISTALWSRPDLTALNPTSALPLKADPSRTLHHVRFAPLPDVPTRTRLTTGHSFQPASVPPPFVVPTIGFDLLHRILRSYAMYYNKIRTHRSLDKAPIWRPVQRTGGIASNPILGGLHHYYIRI